MSSQHFQLLYLNIKVCVKLLAKVLISNAQDGGALIHRVKWLKGATYKVIAKSYVSYVYQHYEHSCH